MIYKRSCLNYCIRKRIINHQHPGNDPSGLPEVIPFALALLKAVTIPHRIFHRIESHISNRNQAPNVSGAF